MNFNGGVTVGNSSLAEAPITVLYTSAAWPVGKPISAPILSFGGLLIWARQLIEVLVIKQINNNNFFKLIRVLINLIICEADKNILQCFSLVFISQILQAFIGYNITFINNDHLAANGLHFLHNMG